MKAIIFLSCVYVDVYKLSIFFIIIIHLIFIISANSTHLLILLPGTKAWFALGTQAQAEHKSSHFTVKTAQTQA